MSYGRIYFLLKEKVNKENFNRGSLCLPVFREKRFA